MQMFWVIDRKQQNKLKLQRWTFVVDLRESQELNSYKEYNNNRNNQCSKDNF